jgi:hypothetical protein
VSDVHVYLFQYKNGIYKKILVDIHSFKNSFLIIQKGRSLIRATLQVEIPLSLYDLRTGDIIHVYIKEGDLSKLYLMDYAKAHFVPGQYLETQTQEIITDMAEKNQLELTAIKNNINYIVQHHSDLTIDKFRTLTEALFFATTDPSFVKQIQDQLKVSLHK